MNIEIGTSDFRTLAGKVDGLYIEPVKEHFDRLPDCNKENVAVSNIAGELDIFYIPSEVILAYKLPNWIRGCNSVHAIHPTVKAQGYSHLVVHDRVKVVRIKSLIEKYNITEIDTLKIDTEGHDCIILNDFLDTVDILPNVIQFESNVLSSVNDVMELVFRLTDLGYDCKQVNFDMVCKL